MLIIDQLWYELLNLEPHTKGDKEYFRELETLAELSDKLTPMLNEDEKKLYEQISDKQLILNSIGEKDAFASGVRFGVKLMLDALYDVHLHSA